MDYSEYEFPNQKTVDTDKIENEDENQDSLENEKNYNQETSNNPKKPGNLPKKA